MLWRWGRFRVRVFRVRRLAARWAAGGLALVWWFAGGGTGTARAVDFAREVFPVLQARCFGCHGPERQRAGLRLDARAGVLQGGKSGPAIRAGSAEESLLFRRVAGLGGEDLMPPEGDGLTEAELGRMRAWLEQGAVWPAGVGMELDRVIKHWAYERPVRPALPAVKDSGWPRNGIDHFILARLEAEGLQPLPEAERATLIRRVSLDLIGLPPSPRDVRAFVRDRGPGAYERLVERLLDSPHYGERWAVPWLDLARYADTNGYEKDERRSHWLYRDWVIEALNRDMAFDEFTVAQLAGDLLPGATREQRIATGFHRNTMVNTEGGTDDEEFRVAAVVDRVNTTFSVWLGTTLGCSQCHDHKYDPFSQQEYYQVFAYFNQTRDGGRSNEPVLEVPSPEQAARRAEVRAQIAPLQRVLETQTAELDQRQEAWERRLAAVRARLAAGWRVLEAAAFEAGDGVTFERLADGSVRAGGSLPAKSVYEVRAETERTVLSAVRLEVLADDRMPAGGSGRSELGNFVLSEVEVRADPIQADGSAATVTPVFGVWHSVGPFPAASPGEAFDRAFVSEPAVDLGQRYGEGQLGWVERPEWKDGVAQALPGEVVATYLYRVIEVAVSTAIYVSLRGDDGLQLWLNGEKLLARNAARGVGPDLERVRLELAAGENRLLLKVSGRGGGHGFYFALSADQSGAHDVVWERAYADVSPEGYEVGGLWDGNPRTGWAVGSLEATNRVDRYAVLVPRRAFALTPRTRLVVRLKHQTEAGHLLGRFRVAVSTAPLEDLRAWAEVPLAVRRVLEREVGERVAEERARLAAHYRSIDPALDEVRSQIASLRKQEPKDIASTLVLAAVDTPRRTHVLERGSFRERGAEVQPGVPAVLHPLPVDAGPDRLGLARWLVDPANPLVGRVTMNRLWEGHFGRGLVETSEDFGTQGEPPTHPELLDWLATEFLRRGWSLKAMHRLMVTSATYRQRAQVAPALAERDPDNRLLARGVRLRLTAELVRDSALAVGGLLDPKLGGPSVFPMQPEGIWNIPYSSDRWVTSAGGDQYRRGVYTFWRRTAPYATFATFDAPSREVCTVRRPRTNTPLQALATLNDPAFTVASAGLARRILREGGPTVRSRLGYGFRCALARRPTAEERAHLAELYWAALRQFRADPAAAEAAAVAGLGPPDGEHGWAEAAAWTVVANVLLNLDEALTRG